METVALIPAFDEADGISEVVKEVSEYVDDVLVVDDGSHDKTAEVSEEAGARVVRHERNRGYLRSLETGFSESDADVVVTLDADGEMDPSHIPKLLKPVENDDADLVIGKRRSVPRISERFLSSLAGLSTDISDTGSGYRALRTVIAREMDLKGLCPCGTFVLEAEELGARIVEVPVETRGIEGSRNVAWKHFFQFWYVLKSLVSG